MSTTAYATPGEARSAIIDFTTADGLKYFTTATKGIDPKYDLKPEGLQAFLEHVRKRAFNFGFTSALEIPTQASLTAYLEATATTGPLPPPPPTSPPPRGTATRTPPPPLVKRNLLTQYGTITISECQSIAKTYYGTTRDRSCQNSAMLYNFISNSITDTALTELALESTKYMYSTNADGACFLKLLISKVQVDTISTVNVLRASISKLDTKIVEYKGDIKQFHRQSLQRLSNHRGRRFSCVHHDAQRHVGGRYDYVHPKSIDEPSREPLQGKSRKWNVEDGNEER